MILNLRGRNAYCIILLLSLFRNFVSKCLDDSKQFLVTFHPHLDAFWLNYDTQLKDISFEPQGFLYSMNQRNSKIIFNSMLQSLSNTSKRKYFISQIYFFKDWYSYLDLSSQQKVKLLIHNQQLQIVNGGWVQNDQAVCYFQDILDQYTLGHNFLYSQFKYQTKIGWATDSFGHSHSQVALQHLLGFQFQGIQRVDQRYIHEHDQEPLLQFYWEAFSDSNNKTYGGVINYIWHFLHQFDNLRVKQKRQLEEDFQQLAERMSKLYKKEKLFIFLGNDFQQFIPTQFEKIQQVFLGLNSYYDPVCLPFKYGNPSDYFHLINKYYQSHSLPSRKYDFIPNWDQDRYWTGYYTTNPLLKKQSKDYSKLVNLFRKIILMEKVKYPFTSVLTEADQLLSLIQHHDGITGTSKSYIQDDLKKKINNCTVSIINQIKNIYQSKADPKYVCELYRNSNICKFKRQWEEKRQFEMSILTLGGPKILTIQITDLAQNKLYKVQNRKFDTFCEDNGVCRIIFKIQLFSGINKVRFLRYSSQQILDQIVSMYQMEQFNNKQISLKIDKKNNQIHYSYADRKFIKLGYYAAVNKGAARQTSSWDKYGNQNKNIQHITSGVYIMFNNGKLQQLGHQFTNMSIGIGQYFNRFCFKTNIISLQIITQKKQLNIIDLYFSFAPPNNQPFDYFLKVSSNVQSSTLYHDSNGYLVSKRILNQRPDYFYQTKIEDILNSNTYPVTTFAYLLQQNQKFVFFSDRSQGVCNYNNSLLINFDRLTYDDGKGVGEGYLKKVHNIFHYRFGIVSKKDDIQRIWQRESDEGLLGFVNSNMTSRVNQNNKQLQYGNKGLKYLKYSVTFLNNNEYVLRLINLCEFQNIEISKFLSNSLKIDYIGLQIDFTDIVQSYANGIPKQQQKQRQYIKNSDKDINSRNQGNLDKDNMLIIRPLQIRSFRINLTEKILKNYNKLQQRTIQSLKKKKQTRLSFRKRCQ